MRYLFVILLFSCSLGAHSQAEPDSKVLQNLKSQADSMGKAFITGNYKTFAGYTYPVILKAMGGAAKMEETLIKSINDWKGQGMSFKSVHFGEPSSIEKSGKELQATIPQHIEIKLTQGRLVTNSTLIAISTDNGLHWTFVDTSNKDIATLRKVLPNLSPAITISPHTPPLRYDD